MSECAAFFARLDAECAQANDNSIRGKKILAERYERLLEWEKQTASSHSPNPVQDGEYLRRALYEGQDIRDGSLVRTAFSSLETVGFSTDRCFASLESSHERSRARVKSGKPLVGYIEMDVQHLRQLQLVREDKTSLRAVGVYDTATNENTSHAEALLVARDSNSRPMKAITADLMDRYKSKILGWPVDGNREAQTSASSEAEPRSPTTQIDEPVDNK
jgi:hypothetical protein